MIPPLDNRGLLPEGVHSCSFDEVAVWADGDLHRRRIWGGLEHVLPTVKQPFNTRGLAAPPLTLAGSYFSDKPAPGDIEVVLNLPLTYPPEVLGECYVCAQLHHNSWHAEQLVDYYVTIDGLGNDLRAFFQYVGPKTGAAKGLPPKSKRGIVQVMTW